MQLKLKQKFGYFPDILTLGAHWNSTGWAHIFLDIFSILKSVSGIAHVHFGRSPLWLGAKIWWINGWEGVVPVQQWIFCPNFLAQGAFLSSSIVMAEELTVGPEIEPLFIYIVTKPPHCFNVTHYETSPLFQDNKPCWRLGLVWIKSVKMVLHCNKIFRVTPWKYSKQERQCT
jgi:hypothetical protein